MCIRLSTLSLPPSSLMYQRKNEEQISGRFAVHFDHGTSQMCGHDDDTWVKTQTSVAVPGNPASGSPMHLITSSSSLCRRALSSLSKGRRPASLGAELVSRQKMTKVHPVSHGVDGDDGDDGATEPKTKEIAVHQHCSNTHGCLLASHFIAHSLHHRWWHKTTTAYSQHSEAIWFHHTSSTLVDVGGICLV